MASKRMDCEAELQMLVDQVTDSARAAKDAGHRVCEAEERATELQQRLEELLTARVMTETAESGMLSGREVTELEKALPQVKCECGNFGTNW